ncbi:hypothetical protein BX600DRAFT_497836 [Xylariales sp. PMI_506]|nr:hypothetical protein BX600DRAFT_497836 [Xylariales sp. PMI_506]
MATREGKDSGHNPTPDGNDCIDEVLYLYMSRYFNLTLLVNQIKKLPRASKHDVRALLLQLEGQLDGDALEQMLEDPEDFVTTEPRRVHGPFEPWIYSYVGPMLDFFDRVLPNGSALKQGERIYLSVNLVANILRAVSGLVCLFLLLAPIGVLLLHPMSNANAFGLVCGFAVVIFCLANLLTMTMDQMLLMFCGYIAVMVAFLANLDQTRCIS